MGLGVFAFFSRRNFLRSRIFRWYSSRVVGAELPVHLAASWGQMVFVDLRGALKLYLHSELPGDNTLRCSQRWAFRQMRGLVC